MCIISYEQNPKAHLVQDERLTGRPHLMTTESMVGTSFEGAAVRQAAASGDVRSAIGPY